MCFTGQAHFCSSKSKCLVTLLSMFQLTMPSYNTIIIFKQDRAFDINFLNFINIEYDNMDKCIYLDNKSMVEL